MSMKMMYACLMCLLCSMGPAFAQDSPPSANDIVTKMQAKLNLTQDQVTGIAPIIANYTSKFQALRQQAEDGTIDRSDMRSQMKDLREAEAKELGQFLSADQLDQWKKMMQHHRGEHRNNGEGGNGNNGGPGSGGDDPSPGQE